MMHEKQHVASEEVSWGWEGEWPKEGTTMGKEILGENIGEVMP